MPDYKLGKIYAIRSHLTDEIYIGSTTQSLSQRFGGHKRRKDTTSVKLFALGDAYIELIENYPCANIEELKRREGQLQREYLEKIVNRKIEGRTKAEYDRDNKEKKAEYYQSNKEKIAAYYQANKEKLTQYQRDHIMKKKLENPI